MSSPEPGCCCRVIQTMLQSSLQELVHIINPAQAVMDLDWLAQELEGAACEKESCDGFETLTG